MSQNKKWISIFFKYGIVGFLISEISFRLIYMKFMQLVVFKEESALVNTLFNLHYFIDFFVLFLAGTMGLVINLLREYNKKLK